MWTSSRALTYIHNPDVFCVSESFLGVIYTQKQWRNNYCYLSISIPRTYIYRLFINYKRTQVHIKKKKKSLWNFVPKDELGLKNRREGRSGSGARSGDSSQTAPSKLGWNVAWERRQATELATAFQVRGLEVSSPSTSTQVCFSISIQQAKDCSKFSPRDTRWKKMAPFSSSPRVEREVWKVAEFQA